MAPNDSAVSVLGDETLRGIAREQAAVLSVGWAAA